MKPVSVCLFAFLVGSERLALAAESAPEGRAQPSSQAEGVRLALAVEAAGLEVDEASVREAIADELRWVTGPDASNEPLRVGLRLERGGELTVTLRTSGRELSRTVAAPGRADQVPEIAALLVGNLARDEADGLLAELRQSEATSASEAPSPERVGVSAEPAGAEPAGAEPGASAESAGGEPVSEPRRLALDGVNLSLFHPLTLRRSTEERRLAFELGLFYSRLGAVSGAALNLVLARVDGEASGWVLGGLGYYVGGPAQGVLIGGAFGVARESFEGVSLGTAANLHFGAHDGVQLTAGVNVAAGGLSGVQLGAGLNLAGDVTGLQASGGLNIATGSVEGAQLAGALNVAADPLIGAQLSGGVNIAERLSGMQLSIVNIGGDVQGLQLGIVNVARDVEGAQVGIVNVARSVEGVSMGLVPYSQEGRTQAVAWYNTSQPLNLGVRFYSGVLYAMPTFGVNFSSEQDGAGAQSSEPSYSPGFSLGLRLPIGRAFADLDVNYSNRSNGLSYDEHNVDLRYRVLAGWQFTRAFGLFAGGGLRHHFRTQGAGEESVDPELSLGVQVL